MREVNALASAVSAAGGYVGPIRCETRGGQEASLVWHSGQMAKLVRVVPISKWPSRRLGLGSAGVSAGAPRGPRVLTQPALQPERRAPA